MSIIIPTELLNRPVRIAVIGLAGPGLHLLRKLVTLDRLLVGAGHPGGLVLEVHESSTRLLSELKRSDQKIFQTVKITALQFNAKEAGRGWDILVSSNLSDPHRFAIERDFTGPKVQKHGVHYWMDLETIGLSGKVHLAPLAKGPAGRKKPELVQCLNLKGKPKAGSLVDQLGGSNPFAADIVAGHAASMLWTLFRSGSLVHEGVLVDTAFGITKPVAP